MCKSVLLKSSYSPSTASKASGDNGASEDTYMIIWDMINQSLAKCLLFPVKVDCKQLPQIKMSPTITTDS